MTPSHHGTGGRGHEECRAAEGAIAERMSCGSRSDKVSHVQSVVRQEAGDKLCRVTGVAQAPAERPVRTVTALAGGRGARQRTKRSCREVVDNGPTVDYRKRGFFQLEAVIHWIRYRSD